MAGRCGWWRRDIRVRPGRWIGRIEIRDRVHDGRLMEEYRIDGEVIEEMPVNCVITRPANGFEIASGQPLRIGGYAWSGRTRSPEGGGLVGGGAFLPETPRG